MERKSRIGTRPHRDKCPLTKNDFVIDEIDIHEIVLESIKATIANDKMYKTFDSKFWSSAIVENCLQALTKLQKNYKYIAQSLVVENNGTSVNSASSCFFDEKTDGAITARWSNNEILVIVSVYCIALPGED